MAHAHHQQHDKHESATSSKRRQFAPLLAVLGGIIGAVGIIQVIHGRLDLLESMRLFMGFFFLAFGMFKVIDWRGFVDMFVDYDVVAKRVQAYAWLYPAVELVLGMLYVTNTAPVATNIVTASIMFIGAIGVTKAVLDKKRIRCACLGAVVKLPMTTVTIIEDVGMGVMALIMLAMHL